MARESNNIFSAATNTFSWTMTAGATVTGQARPITNDPPTAKQVASICISGATASGSDTLTVKCQLGYGHGSNRIWGNEHTITDTDSNTTWAVTTTESVFEANLYEQSWWTICDYVRIIIEAAGSSTVAGSAVLVIQ